MLPFPSTEGSVSFRQSWITGNSLGNSPGLFVVRLKRHLLSPLAGRSVNTAAARSSHLPIPSYHPCLPCDGSVPLQIWWGHMLLGHTYMMRPNLAPLTLWAVSALSGRSFWSRRREREEAIGHTNALVHWRAAPVVLEIQVAEIRQRD